MENIRLLSLIDQEICKAEKRFDHRKDEMFQSATDEADLSRGRHDLKKLEYSLADMHEVRRVVMNHMLSEGLPVR